MDPPADLLDYAALGRCIFQSYLRMANTVIDRDNGIDTLVVFKATYEAIGARRFEDVIMPDARSTRIPLHRYYCNDLRQMVDYFRIPMPHETLAGNVFLAIRGAGFRNVRIWGRTVYLVKQ